MRVRCATLLVAVVLATGASVQAQTPSLLQAVKAGNRAAVEALMAKRPDVNVADPDGTTALQWAARADDLAIAQMLVTAGADVNAANHYSATALFLAAENASVDMVGLLLKAGADANTISGEGETVLMTAARSGSAAAIRLLTAAGANVNAREPLEQETALMWAAAGNHAAAVTALAEAGADLNARSRLRERERFRVAAGVITFSKGGMSPLLFAARNGAADAVRALAAAGASLNLTDPDGINALSVALLSGQYDTAAALIEVGSDVNLADITGRTPLFVAVDMHTPEWRMNRPSPRPRDRVLGPIDIVKMLLDHGANPNAALTRPALSTKYFASSNPNLSAGSTPFLKAATTSDVELMRLLVERGADPHVVNLIRTNAMMMAAGINWRVLGMGLLLNTQEEAITAISYLIDELGFDINATNDQLQTALHAATHRSVDRDSSKLIQFLVERGADLYAKDRQGRTPFDLASGVGNENAGGGQGAGAVQPNPVIAAQLKELMASRPAVTAAAAAP
jgi:ankyrin repeat protein